MKTSPQTAITAWIKANKKYFHQGYAAVMASFTYFAMGEIRSWSSSGIPSIQGKDGRNATLSQGPLPVEVVSWITSAVPLGAIFSALIAGFVLQKYGRKVTLLASVAVTLVAFVVLATSKIHEIPAVMIAARAMMGITVGFSMPSATIYIAECTDPKIRGLLGSLPAVFMAFGISFVYLMGAFMPWHILSYVCTAVPLFTLIGIIFSPESPVWLVANGKIKEADRASNWLNGIEEPIVKNGHATLAARKSQAVEELLAKAKEAEAQAQASPPPPFFTALRSKQVWHPFVLCLAVMVFQQWSGVNAIIFNTVTIFNAANVTIDMHLATNIVGAVQLFATFMSILVVDKAGRRILLFLSGIVMSMSMAAIGAFFFLFSDPETADAELRSKLEWLPLVSLIVYMIGYSIGFACVPFLLLGEMLPARMRNLLGAAVSSFNLAMTFLVLKFFTTIYLSIGFHGLFWIYAVFSLAGGIFGYIFIPETKGKTLKEIEAHFVGNAPVESQGTV